MKMYEGLRKKLRKGLGRNVDASAGIIDSQSVMTTFGYTSPACFFLYTSLRCTTRMTKINNFLSWML